MFSKQPDTPGGTAAMPALRARRRLKPGERIIGGRVFYSAAWLAHGNQQSRRAGTARPLESVVTG